MAEVIKDAAEVDFWRYTVTLDGQLIGYCNDVDPSALKIITTDIKIGELGDIPVDEAVVGLSGTVKVDLAQCKAATLRALTPWASGTGAFPLLPSTQFQRLYTYAKKLVVHPNGVTGTTEDLTLVKVVPMYSFPKMSQGNKQRSLPVEFKIFPDQAQLTAATPTLVYGYVGPAPA